MAKPIIGCLGDIHLSHHIWDSHHEIKDDAITGFTSFVDQCIALGIPMMLCGDIFDVPNPPPDIIRVFRVEMSKAEAANIPVYYYQGNHDKRPTPWGIAVHDWPQYIGDGAPFELDGIRCVAYDYQGRDRIQTCVAGINMMSPLPQVVFFHQAAKQALNFEGAWNMDLDWLSPGIPVAILGDIHSPLEMKIPGGRGYYTGASSPRNKDEFVAKSFLILHDDLTVSRMPLRTRAFKRFTWTSEVTPEIVAWLRDIQNPVAKPVCWLFYKESEYEGLQATLAALKPLELVVITESRLDRNGDAATPEEVSADTDAATILKQSVDPDKEPEAFALALDLLDPSREPMDVIQTHKDTFSAHYKATT